MKGKRRKENSRALFGSVILGMVGARKDCGTILVIYYYYYSSVSIHAATWEHDC